MRSLEISDLMPADLLEVGEALGLRDVDNDPTDWVELCRRLSQPLASVAEINQAFRRLLPPGSRLAYRALILPGRIVFRPAPWLGAELSAVMLDSDGDTSATLRLYAHHQAPRRVLPDLGILSVLREYAPGLPVLLDCEPMTVRSAVRRIRRPFR